jgi:sugar lactone lactonase YvrE
MAAVERFPEPDVLIAAEASVGEGPVFDHRTGRLCWVDIVEGILHESGLTDGRQTVATLGTMVGAVAPREQASGFVVAVADGFGYWTSGQLVIADPVLPEAHRRMNDAKCDSHGRLWAGSTHMQFVPGIGALHRWDGSESSVTMAAGLTLPNGLGWKHEDTRMYLVDSLNNNLLSASFHPDEGKVGTFSSLCKIDPGLPDGLAVDLDGSIWGRRLGRRGGAPLRPHRRTHRGHSNASHPAGKLRVRSRRNPLHHLRTERPKPHRACQPTARRICLRAPDQHARRPGPGIRCLNSRFRRQGATRVDVQTRLSALSSAVSYAQKARSGRR